MSYQFKKVCSGKDAGRREGTVGFRAGSAAEQGIFRNIDLKEIE